MHLLSPDSLIFAAERLLRDIGTLAENEEKIDLNRLYKSAHTLCSQLKAAEAIEHFNIRQEAQEIGQHYTRYEDLPPLPPEERDRFERELIDLLSPREIDTGKSKPKRISKPSKTQH